MDILIIYIMIGFLILFVLILIFALLILISKRKEQIILNSLKEEQTNFKLEVLKLVSESNQKGQGEMFKNINDQFEYITKNVNSKITESFKKTDETFVSVVERLTKIDEQNKNISKLSTEVLNLNNILTDKLSRGTFGETQLAKILESVLGNNKTLYELQTKLPNGTIPDAIIYSPEPLGMIAVDSKFPLENYRNYQNVNNTSEQKQKFETQFKRDLIKHIKDISSKYIIADATANQAIMFIPAEQIYLEVINNHLEVMDFAYENKVWITSPTTLIATLTIIESVSNTVRQTKQTAILVEELKLLGIEFARFKDRTDSLIKNIDNVFVDLKNLTTTNNKLYRRFNDIESGKLEKL